MDNAKKLKLVEELLYLDDVATDIYMDKIRKRKTTERERKMSDLLNLIYTIIHPSKSCRHYTWEKEAENLYNSLFKPSAPQKSKVKNPMKKSVWKIKKVCGNCGKPFVPDKEAMIFGTKKWDGHTYKYNCDCLKNKNIRISIF